MLVLTRKLKEKIIIGELGDPNQIVITILKITDGCVKIGIEADRNTPINREELKIKKQASASTIQCEDNIETSVQKFQIDLCLEDVHKV